MPATSSWLSRLPACRPGGLLLTRPSSGAGATPMLPKNGFSGIDDARQELRRHRLAIEPEDLGAPRLRSQFSRMKPLQPL